MESSMSAWMNEFEGTLVSEFGDRLVLLGLQGSRARGDERPDSDIDVVVIIDALDYSTLHAYKKVVSRMPNADLACGFASSPQVLAEWPRHDSFNLVMDTRVFYGSFEFMNTDYTAEDAAEAAKASASMIYHSVCHGVLFDDEALFSIVAECIKSAFFIMRALAYVRTGEYPKSRMRMRELATDDELVFLDAYDHLDAIDIDAMAQALLAWSSNVLAGK